jgi:hypothetical protein
MTYDFLSLKYDVNVVSKSKKQKKEFLVVFLKVTDETTRIRIRVNVVSKSKKQKKKNF